MLYGPRRISSAGEFAEGVTVRIYHNVKKVKAHNDTIMEPKNIVPEDVNNWIGFLSTLKLAAESQVALSRTYGSQMSLQMEQWGMSRN